MEIFYHIIEQITPIIFIIVFSFTLGRIYFIPTKPIADFTIYMASPIVYFMSFMAIPINSETLTFPLITLTLITMMSLFAYKFPDFVLKNATSEQHQKVKSIVGASAGSLNSGYIGFPVALALFGPEWAAVWMLASTSTVIYETTLAYYFLAKANYSTKDSIKMMLKLPVLYVILLVVLLRSAGVTDISPSFKEILEPFKNVYIVLGSSIIGLSIANTKGFQISAHITLMTFFLRLVAWPLIILAFILLNQNYLHILSNDYIKLLVLLGCLPLAANFVAYTNQLNIYKNKAPTLILLSTITSIILISILFSVLNTQLM